MNEVPELEWTTPMPARIEHELSVVLPSWNAGIWCLNSRIAFLLEMERSLNKRLRESLEESSHSIEKAVSGIQSLNAEASSVRLYTLNAHRLMGNHGFSLERVTKLLLLSRRRERMRKVLETAYQLVELSAVVSKITPMTVASSLVRFRNVIECLPPDLNIIPVLQQQLGTKIGLFRHDLIKVIVQECCALDTPDFENSIIATLRDSYGVGTNSILSNEVAFWFLSSSEEESELVACAIDCFLHDLHFRSFFSGESWTGIRDSDCKQDCRSWSQLRRLISRFSTVVAAHISVMGGDFVSTVTVRLHEKHLILVLMAYSGSDLSTLISPPEEKASLGEAHESFIRRKRLVHLNSLLNSEFWIMRLEFINQMVPRHRSVSVYQLCAAVESVACEVKPELINELRWSVYESTVSSSLAHAMQRWHHDVFEDPVQANSYLALEVGSFISFLRTINIPAESLNSMGLIIQEVVTSEILCVIPSLYRELRGGDDTHILTELVRDLQQQVGSMIQAEPSRWSLIYEGIQALSMESGDFMLLWAQEQLSRIPVSILADFISTAEYMRLEVGIKLIDDLRDKCRTFLYSDSQ